MTAASTKEGMMSPEENARRIKQLELIQNIVTRMSQSSFLIKGWAVTLCSALLALSGKDTKQNFALLALFPAAVFCGLDAYYLSVERRYRARYEELAGDLQMSLSLGTPAGASTWRSALRARVVSLHYGAIMLVAVLVALRNAGKLGDWW